MKHKLALAIDTNSLGTTTLAREGMNLAGRKRCRQTAVRERGSGLGPGAPWQVVFEEGHLVGQDVPV